MKTLILHANAKVNLGLHIRGRRADGYHLMETLYYPVASLADEVELRLVAGEECGVRMDGLAEEVPLERNLCWRAWALLAPVRRARGGACGLDLRVRKRIPAGAGLGGGSSDAAAVLKGLNELWDLGLSDAELAGMGEQLGADVPFFIYNKPLYATGIGTAFEPFELDLEAMGYRLELLTSDEHSSTPQAFKELRLAEIPQGEPLKALLALPLEAWQGRVRNDLEGPVFARLPGVAAAKADLLDRGAVFALMSGSGSACFGIFRK